MRKIKSEEINKLIVNIETINNEIYTMQPSTKNLLINQFRKLNIISLQLLNIHLEDLNDTIRQAIK